jgi:hypothetical protein
MNDVYNYILIQDLKKLPKHSQTFDPKKLAKAVSGLNQLELTGKMATLEAFQDKADAFIKSLSVLEARSRANIPATSEKT